MTELRTECSGSTDDQHGISIVVAHRKLSEQKEVVYNVDPGDLSHGSRVF